MYRLAVDLGTCNTVAVVSRPGAAPRLSRTTVAPVRLPLVASRLHARFGVVPVVPEQPELPVAYGAVLGPTPRQADPGPPERRPDAPPVDRLDRSLQFV